MNKGDLIEAVAARLGESKTVATKAVDAVLEALVDGVRDDEKVAIAGFGTFKKRQRKARQGINPVTREPMTIAASTTVAFTASPALKDMVEAAGVR